MRISGLSNQWKTRDGLFATYAVAHDSNADPICNERSRVIRDLLLYLESLAGPDLWIGTSHRMLNFNLRDTSHELDHLPSFLTVHTYTITDDPPQCGYRIGYSLTGAEWEYTDLTDALDAAALIKRLLRATGG